MAIHHFMIEGERFDSRGNHKESIKLELSYAGQSNLVTIIVFDSGARKQLLRIAVPKDQLLDAVNQPS